MKFFGDMSRNGGVEDRWKTLRPTLPGQFRDSAGSGKPEAALRTWTKTPEEDNRPEEKRPPRNKDEIFRGYETKVHTREQTQQSITPFPRKISHTIPASPSNFFSNGEKFRGNRQNIVPNRTGIQDPLPSSPLLLSFPRQKSQETTPEKSKKSNKKDRILV